ncbi:prostaglandin D2 receptor 2 [Salmo salar]|uniref:Prostaglandin D2 receptor 2 n=1 Tax=Salmo salar TaxID=8030 RepID=A0ABM3F6K1_SALSA|nr:prostaglandin D2 receptor 2-like [Salmo salar]
MFNSSSSAVCPLLQTMLDHSVNNNTGVNLVVVCVHGLVSCLGILENALVLWVLGFRLRRRTVASVWVLNLALSDFLATLTLPLFTHYLHSSHSWELGGPLCTAQSSVFFLNMFVSAFLLAAISLDRCLLVARPVWSQNHRSISAAWKVCALGWLWAAANTFPYFLFRAVTEKTDGRKLCYHHFGLYSSPGTLERDCRVRQAATAVSKTFLAFLLPLVVIAGSYALFGISLSQRRKRRRKDSSSGLTGALIVTNVERRESKPNTNTKSSTPNPKGSTPTSTSIKLSSRRTEPGLSRGFTKMVTSVIATFALCWAPYHVFCLIEVAAQYWPTKVVLVEVGLPMATTFAFLNPVLNPVLYAFSCPNFCIRIRQSLGSLMEGLVEEGGMGGAGGGGLGLSIRKGRRKGRGSLGGTHHRHQAVWGLQTLCICLHQPQLQSQLWTPGARRGHSELTIYSE